MDQRKSSSNSKITAKIRIWGIVQGVGFRPFIAKLAKELGKVGQVRNLGGLVEIVMTDTKEGIADFLAAMKDKKPGPSEIVHIKTEEIPFREFSGFDIVGSGIGTQAVVKKNTPMIPIDLAICSSCLKELYDPKNPRYQHPFISCMECGPRYTIIDQVPYDRDNTSMVDFPMCDFCESEYTSIDDRRYHAQTISCFDCGPQIKKQDIEEATKELKKGNIVAVKGVGGYNFVCTPFDEKTVDTLREIKGREHKPFAVMFSTIEDVRKYCLITEEEASLLQSSARPIMLLEKNHKEILNKDNMQMAPNVSGTSRFTGSFLPSFGLQYLLLDACGPLIVTSANLSDMPMIKDDEEMAALAEKIPDIAMVLSHNRRIHVRVDDSVVRIIDRQPQMIRRSKGYVPKPVFMMGSGKAILSTGGQLKSSFSLATGDFAYISQYLGDLSTIEACKVYEESVAFMEHLFKIKPEIIVSDLHPLYFTTEFAKRYALEKSIPHIKVQHHHAHIASVMAEESIEDSVIGVSFDGTGYGLDGAVWGGEVFVYRQGQRQKEAGRASAGESANTYMGFERIAHLEYVDMIGGDSSMKEGWKSAICYIRQLGEEFHEEGKALLNKYDEIDEDNISLAFSALHARVNIVKSSSMGRLFDAVAAIVGINSTNRYEGECAIMLENIAADAIRKKEAPWDMHFDISYSDEEKLHIVSAKSIFESILKGLRHGVSKEAIALGFHYAVSQMIVFLCKEIMKKEEITHVVLTGGVFQNKILMEHSLGQLRMNGFHVSYNTSVGTNDGGICLGQGWIANREVSTEDCK